MKQTINFSQFCDGFSGSYENNFSYEGKRALFNYLEEYEEEIEDGMEFDPVALCCEFTEYKDILEFLRDYDLELDTCIHCGEGLPSSEFIELNCPDCDQPMKDTVLEELQKKTTVIDIPNSDGFIIQSY